MLRYLLRCWGRLRRMCTSSSHRRSGVAQLVQQVVRQWVQGLRQRLHLAQQGSKLAQNLECVTGGANLFLRTCRSIHRPKDRQTEIPCASSA